MTDDMMNLKALMEKSPDAGFLREMIGYAAQRLMELEVGGLTGAAHDEKSADRLVQRNGYRDRDWETRAGTVEPGGLYDRVHRRSPVPAAVGTGEEVVFPP